jgi:iron complex outermembrane receptor protein
MPASRLPRSFSSCARRCCKTLAGAHELLFDTGYRRSDYSTAGVTNTYKFEVQYAPIADYRLRAILRPRHPRSPVSRKPSRRPSSGSHRSATTPARLPIKFNLLQCERTGVTAAQYNSGSIPQGTADQLAQETSGNSALKPEQADTYTLGVNFAPAQIPHFTGSIDYYHIQVKDEIGVIPYLVILSDCANTGDPTYCSQIVRSPSTGSLTGNSIASGGYVIQKDYNLGTAVVSGIDVQMNYRVDLPAGLRRAGMFA